LKSALAVLKTIGLTKRQPSATIAWQAMVAAIIRIWSVTSRHDRLVMTTTSLAVLAAPGTRMVVYAPVDNVTSTAVR